MTSLRQWAANRENAQKSTGPRTEEGKRRTRRNALRHGLTAETVIDGLEDTEDYRAFEATIIADYDATTAVERELVLRLACLLWRIRRATGIEADLFRIQAEIIRERERGGHGTPATSCHAPQPASRNLPRLGYGVLRPVGSVAAHDQGAEPEELQAGCPAEDEAGCPAEDDFWELASTTPSRKLTHCFLRLANLDNAVFDRLARYEATLWRQIVQTMLALEPLRRQRYRFG
jgi:hypothetical protein